MNDPIYEIYVEPDDGGPLSVVERGFQNELCWASQDVATQVAKAKHELYPNIDFLVVEQLGHRGPRKVVFRTSWPTICKRTNKPKLTWLEAQWKAAGLRTKREGHSYHAPIVKVHPDDEDAARAILHPVDDIPDDDPQFH